MPNKNYVSGRAKEYREMESLRREGYLIVARSAGSHSPIDVWAIDPLKKRIALIQCKSGQSAEKERSKALKELERVPRGYYFVEVRIA